MAARSRHPHQKRSLHRRWSLAAWGLGLLSICLPTQSAPATTGPGRVRAAFLLYSIFCIPYSEPSRLAASLTSSCDPETQEIT